MVNRFFKDKKGHTVIWQWPNIPMYGWLIFTLLSFAISNTPVKQSFSALAKAWLFTWAYLELTQGVNYFRRLLGLIVIIAATISFFLP